MIGARKDSIHVSVTTISPMAATQLAKLHQEKGVHYISGPVSEFDLLSSILCRGSTLTKVSQDRIRANSPKAFGRYVCILIALVENLAHLVDINGMNHRSARGYLRLDYSDRRFTETYCMNQVFLTLFSLPVFEVLGRPDVAATGKLRTFLSGPQSIIDYITPILQCYCGGGLIYVGEDPAHACVLKLSANFCVASIIDLFGQVYALNERWKVSTDLTKQLVNMIFTHPGILAYSEKVRTREYSNQGGVALLGGLNNINLMSQMGEEVGVPLPYVSVIHDHIVTAIGNGLGDKDWSAFAESARLNSGMPQKEEDDNLTKH